MRIQNVLLRPECRRGDASATGQELRQWEKEFEFETWRLTPK